MQDFFNKIAEFFQDIWATGKGDFLGALLFAILAACFLFFRKRLSAVIGAFFNMRDKYLVIPRVLQSYKQALDNETLKVNHGWKIEGQSMSDLIVPINVSVNGETTRLGLEKYIADKFPEGIPRLLILGDAGSGKSVSMGFIARSIWQIKRKSPLVPVLLKFSEVKNVQNDADFEAIIIQNLQRFKFDQNKKKTKAEYFVKNNLYEGNILLLIDGFDELPKSARYLIGKFINEFFQKNDKIPFVLSCRVSVWNQNPGIFSSLNFAKVYMADFTPFEIHEFVSHWQFPENKSAEQLANLINSKPYLKNLAVNPLLLTILAFLYSQPKRSLPDNRVHFYKECVAALFEHWDMSRQVERSNQFETNEKITILSRVAYDHIVDSVRTDEDIHKGRIISIIGEVMKSLSRRVEKREQMLTEIVQNAELLIELPPDAYKFPHRTFMEYFAAHYFFEENKHTELLKLYDSDKGKWQETLALFCGLNINTQVSNDILEHLKKSFVETSSSLQPDTFVFRALVESSKINPALAEAILDQADQYLSFNINAEIVEHLGYIAVNPNWQHREIAKKILLKFLSKDISNDDLQKIIFALVGLKDAEIKELILKHLYKINISEFLIKLGKDASEYASRILENIPRDKIREVFTGLQEADALDLLFALLIKSNDREIKMHAAWALALTSHQNVFFRFLDTIQLKDVLPTDIKIMEFRVNSYKWRRRKSDTTAYNLRPNSQKAFFLISYYASQLIIFNNFDTRFYTESGKIHNWLRYFISAEIYECKHSFYKYNLTGNQLKATRSGIISHWLSTKDSGLFEFFSFWLPYCFINIVGMIRHWETSISLKIIGASIPISVLLIIYMSSLGDEKTKFKEFLKYILVVVVLPHFLLFAPEQDLSFIKSNKPSEFILVFGTGAILLAVFYFIPMPTFYKVANVLLILYVIAIFVLKKYIHPLGKWFPNDAICLFLNEKQ